MNVTKVIIIGGNGTALNIAEVIQDAIENYDSKIELLGFANDHLTMVGSYPVVSSIQGITKSLKNNDVKVIYALYKPNIMKTRVELFKSLGLKENHFFNFIHPTVFISNSAKIGTGNVFLPNTVIHSKVIIGNYNIFNSNVVIEHETKISDNNFFSASSIVGSNNKIGCGIFIGLNSSIRESLTINNFSFLGMGSVLTKNMEMESIYYGVPARKYVL